MGGGGESKREFYGGEGQRSYRKSAGRAGEIRLRRGVTEKIDTGAEIEALNGLEGGGERRWSYGNEEKMGERERGKKGKTGENQAEHQKNWSGGIRRSLSIGKGGRSKGQP